MSRIRMVKAGLQALAGLCVGMTIAWALPQAQQPWRDSDPVKADRQRGWRDSFPLDKANLTDTGRGTYFILEPGYRLRFAHGKTTLVVSVLDETRVVDGVTTRVVEERETKDGQLVEISRNFFAMDKSTGDVYYFGEEVDIYKNGAVVGHHGAWLAGTNGARFGLMMPGRPRIGDKFYQEVAPNVAMDRAEILSFNGVRRTPAGTFENVLKTKETTPLEPFAREYKFYAPGIGLIQDGKFKLVRFSPGS